ncbi:MAG: LptE family protein [Deltaproteobacteria bacterium]|nr:LptE family protein [Deltaproteobacteria bacterium]
MLKRVLSLVLALSLAGCGYGFRGTVSYLPQEIKTVAIPYLTNQTGEAGLEVLITEALIREFNRSKLLKLTDIGRADVVLSGKIKGLSTRAVAFEDVRTALQRRVTVSMEMELVQRRDQRVLWRSRAVSDGQDYDVGSGSTATETNREEALQELAKSVAVKVHDSIFENF